MLEYILGLIILVSLASLFIFGKSIFSRKGIVAAGVIGLLMTGGFFLNYHFSMAKEAIADYQNTQSNEIIINNYLHSNAENTDFDSLSQLNLSSLFNGIKRYLQLNPRDSEAWIVLGNLLQGANNPQFTLEAYRKAHLVNPTDAEMALAYVNARLSLEAVSSQLDNESIQILKDVLKNAPNNQQAQILLGVVAFKGEDFSQAIDSWQKALNFLERSSASYLNNNLENNAQPKLPTKPPTALLDGIRKSIDSAKTQLALKLANANAGSGDNINTKTSDNANTKTNITKTDIVSLSAFRLAVTVQFNEAAIEGLKNSIVANQSQLFVYLKQPNESGMPLAAVKIALPEDLSQAIKLVITNQNSLAGADLSAFSELQLSARLSISGQAFAAKGDWETDKSVISSEQFTIGQILVIKHSI